MEPFMECESSLLVPLSTFFVIPRRPNDVCLDYRTGCFVLLLRILVIWGVVLDGIPGMVLQLH